MSAVRSPQLGATAEEWRPVVGFDGYEVSSLGRLATMKRGRWRLLVGGVTSNGYRDVGLYRDGARLKRRVHQLVAEAFLGPRPAGMQVRHLDGDQLNNVATNLCYGTQSQNNTDQVHHGTHNMARRTHCPQGHAYDEANTWREPRSGKRHCRTCRRMHTARYEARRRMAA